MAKYTSHITLHLIRALSKDEIASLEDYLTSAVFVYAVKNDIPLKCLVFGD